MFKGVIKKKRNVQKILITILMMLNLFMSKISKILFPLLNTIILLKKIYTMLIQILLIMKKKCWF